MIKTLIGLAALTPSVLSACGIEWREPKSYFADVDFQGHVLQVQKLAEIDAGQELSLPIYAVFASQSANSSPYAGYGWTVPLLESRMRQVDENVFKLDQPDGWIRIFGRDRKNANILHGQGGWTAEIHGDSLTAVADCGSKLVFTRGRIVAMHLKDRKFDFVYDGDQVSEIREGSALVLRVEKKAATGEVTGFRLADNRLIGLEQSQRPNVQVINNQNLVGGVVQSLSKITLPNGTERRIEYPLDDKLNPAMKLGERLIVWDPGSKKVMRDGDWTYDIKPGPGIFDNAAIGRTNSNQRSEFWHYNAAVGQDIRIVDGVKKITSWFTSGKMAGSLRQKEEITNGVSRVVYQASYDEKGKLAREMVNGSTVFYTNGEVDRISFEDGFALESGKPEKK